MTDRQTRCPRCRGQKSVYRIGRSGYTLENFGGEKVDCPSCAGVGYMTIPDFVEEAKKEQEELSEIKTRRKRRTKEELAQDAGIEESAREEEATV